MNQIVPYQLWIGHAGDGRAFQTLFDKGITALVQLAVEEPSLESPRELVYLRFPLIDGGGNDSAVLRLAIDSVARLVRQNMPTLVCCGAGMSRSPAIAAAALSIVESVDVEICLERVLEMHPADLSTALWKEVCEVVKQGEK